MSLESPHHGAEASVSVDLSDDDAEVGDVENVLAYRKRSIEL